MLIARNRPHSAVRSTKSAAVENLSFPEAPPASWKFCGLSSGTSSLASSPASSPAISPASSLAISLGSSLGSSLANSLGGRWLSRGVA